MPIYAYGIPHETYLLVGFNSLLEMRELVPRREARQPSHEGFNSLLEMPAALNVLARYGLLYAFQFSIGDAEKLRRWLTRYRR